MGALGQWRNGDTPGLRGENWRGGHFWARRCWLSAIRYKGIVIDFAVRFMLMQQIILPGNHRYMHHNYAGMSFYNYLTYKICSIAETFRRICRRRYGCGSSTDSK